MALSREEISHIAKLSRLELSEAEIEKYSTELSGILSYIDDLKRAETDLLIINNEELENSPHPFRPDLPKNWEETEIEMALDSAGGKKGEELKVKRVLI